jgi:signal peptidase I
MGKQLRLGSRQKNTRKPSAKTARRRPFWREVLRPALVLVAFAVIARLLLVQTHHVPSRSMEDSLLLGDVVLVDKVSYGAALPWGLGRMPGWARPQRGDILVYRLPERPDAVLIKRCLALPGQTVEVRNKAVYVDGVRLIDPPFSKYIDARILPADQAPRDNMAPRRVPADAYFAVGDNRDNSRDSRHLGFVPATALVGRGRLVLWSMAPLWGEVADGFLDRLRLGFNRVRWQRIGKGIR